MQAVDPKILGTGQRSAYKRNRASADDRIASAMACWMPIRMEDRTRASVSLASRSAI